MPASSRVRSTWRYQEDADEADQVVSSLYIRKARLGEKAPERLRVTIEAEE